MDLYISIYYKRVVLLPLLLWIPAIMTALASLALALKLRFKVKTRAKVKLNLKFK